MSAMPTTKALFGFDVIGSSSNPDDQLEEVRQAATELVGEAFEHTGVDVAARVNYSATGDGYLAAFPEESLPALVDAAHFLHGQVYLRNRRMLPTIGLRLAVHAAPVTVVDGDSFQRPVIELARLLDAAVVKDVVRRLADRHPVTVATILSAQAYRTAVLAGHTHRLHPHEFSMLQVADKEFEETAWVWIPGVAAGDLTTATATPTADRPAAEPGTPSPAGGSQVINGEVHGTGIIGTNSGSIVYNQLGQHRP
ncbi:MULTISPECIES: hypothetical protein [Amycolatopsis]|uniref:Guanylate cyclase domain-containing protein n=1 Tax=Amycolatopsis bullii TaxID=941987 RepID=A0ABQ3K912_9PSEU|nr:hypothetical protein [Amycolatopsis bullii]GHG05371.1 hypothetical protein GCM10017567_21910 [Amycolatopsis bullii]